MRSGWFARVIMTCAVCSLGLAGAAYAARATPPPPPWSALHYRAVGPALQGGRVTAVAGIPGDAAVYYVGTAGGGVFKSGDGGTTWQAIFARQPVNAIGALALAPSNPDVVWVGTGEANPRNDISYGDGVWLSTDAGKTWSHRGLDATSQISRIVVDPEHPMTAWVAALGSPYRADDHRGVYKTTDGGKTWRKVLYVGPESGAGDVAIDPKNPEILFAGIWQFHRKPWTFTSGGAEDGIWRSVDGGDHWTRLQGHGLPGGPMGRIGLAVAPSDPSVVYALIESKHGLLWRSNDGGDTWHLLTANTLVDQRPFYFTHVVVDPKNADHAYFLSMELVQTKDGGKTFHVVSRKMHPDHHALWIDPDDPRRIIEGNDGGVWISRDAGKTWDFRNDLDIGQIYHVGYDLDNPYHVCVALQDNNALCGPSNSRDPHGILPRDWHNVIGGDGMWAVPDPRDPQRIFADAENGSISLYDGATGTQRDVAPYLFDPSGMAIAGLPYRFNWDAPIVFSPTDPRVLYFGGNVVFESADGGLHWKTISPDLTRDDKAHQQAAGGPITRDVSGAEFSDTILSIAPSPLDGRVIWVGTDDGLVQLTTDGGAHWTNVTDAIPGVGAWGRIPEIFASPYQPGTAFVTIDRHRSGDDAPHLFATADFGKTWRSIAGNLPRDQWVRSIVQDPKNPALLYAGLENGIRISYDGGAHWLSMQNNLPTASVRDLRIQPRFDDLLVATHGRSLRILDDLISLQDLPQAQAAGHPYLFPARTAYEYLSAYREESPGDGVFHGANPPGGAILDFYQSAPAKRRPVVEIFDASGTLVRRLSGPLPGAREEHGHKPKPVVSNHAGINRVIWDLTMTAPEPWLGAAATWNRGPRRGPRVLPGTYTVKLVDGAATATQRLVVDEDPRVHASMDDLRAHLAFQERIDAKIGTLDRALTQLDLVRKQAAADRAVAQSQGRGDVVRAAARLTQAADRAQSAITANFVNFEDSIQRPNAVRERLEELFWDIEGSPEAPTPAMLAEERTENAAYAQALAGYDRFVASDVPAFNAALRKAHLAGGIQARPVR